MLPEFLLAAALTFAAGPALAADADTTVVRSGRPRPTASAPT